MLLKLVLGFLPWIILGVLGEWWLAPALLLGFAAATIMAAVEFRRGRIKIMDGVTLGFFTVTVAAIVVFRWIALASYLGLLASATLMAIAWGSLLAGAPFTLPYAREQTPPEVWHTTRFLRVNQYIAAAWGLDFFLSTLVALYRHVFPDAAPLWKYAWMLFAVVATIFTLRFPAWYTAHARAHAAGADALAAKPSESLPRR